MHCFHSLFPRQKSSALPRASSVTRLAESEASRRRMRFARGKLLAAALAADRKPLPEASLGLRRACPALLGIASSEHCPRPQPVRTRTQERRALDEQPPPPMVVHGRFWASHGRPGTVVVCKVVWSTVRRRETKPMRRKPNQIAPQKQRYAASATQQSRTPAPRSQGAA